MAAPVLGAVTGVPPTVAVVSPPLSKVTTGGGCTPINPCAVATPALDNAPLPKPETSADAAPLEHVAAPGTPRTANADCPPAGPRHARLAGQGGREGQAGAEGFRRLAQASARNDGRGRLARDADGCRRSVPSSPPAR
jgi:hypothetical protein